MSELHHSKFRCLYCGQFVEATPEMPDEINCPHCARKLVVPGRKEMTDLEFTKLVTLSADPTRPQDFQKLTKISSPEIKKSLTHNESSSGISSPSTNENTPATQRSSYRCIYCGKPVEVAAHAKEPFPCPHCDRKIAVPKAATQSEIDPILSLIEKEKVSLQSLKPVEPVSSLDDEKQRGYVLILLSFMG
ncbi:MAG: hypothetical protein SGI71_01740, partial [Verrucomicrobiota bacterium]|nr:hypothetical protein [Verrucomicrobiota bacterium]